MRDARVVALTVFAAFAAGGIAETLSTGAVQVTSVHEPRTKIDFPSSIQVLEAERRQELVGIGVRTKTFLRLKVYAVGLYVDAIGMRDLLEALPPGASVGEEIVDGRFARSVRLVTARKLPGGAMREAFDEALGPRFHRARTTLQLQGDDRDLEEFRGNFAMEHLRKGTELTFSCSVGGSLTSSLDGELLGHLNSEALCWALFDVYLGKKPISRRMKEGLVGRAHLFGR